MLVPPPNGITTASASSAALQDPGDRGLVARSDDDVRHAAEVAAALADEVAQALAARVDDTVVRIVGDVRLPGRLLERGAQAAVDLRRGHVEVAEVRAGARRRARRRRRGAP